MRPVAVLAALAVATPALACDPALPPTQLQQCMLVQLDTMQGQLLQAYNASRSLNRRVADLEATVAAHAARIADLEARLAVQETVALTQDDLDAAGYAPGIADRVVADGDELHLGRLAGDTVIVGLGVDLSSVTTTRLASSGSLTIESAGATTVSGALLQVFPQAVFSATVVAPDVIAGGTTMAALNGRVGALENAP
ncbi:MAG: hypothetical protein H6733_03500 [Alphaproteobacteria bacterium]|nr:hypothetical protein [Alphaproteobacteria bacterium]